jgi:hypothetical protein
MTADSDRKPFFLLLGVPGAILIGGEAGLTIVSPHYVTDPEQD